METQQNVQHYLACMMALENGLGNELVQKEEILKNRPDISAAMEKLRDVSNNHFRVLDDRLHQLHDISVKYDPVDEPDLVSELIHICGLLNEAALGYSVLQSLAHRSFDREGEESTKEIAKKHLNEYAETIKAVTDLILDAIVRELDANDDECLCHCTTCELGICTCSPMGIGRTYREWIDSTSAAPLGRLLVTKPRRDSAALRAGLKSGDTILEADGCELHANADLHAAIRKHGKGERVTLKVRGTSGEIREISVEC